MSTTDSMLARFQAEIEQRHQFVDGLIEDAEKAGRDLATHELERIGKERDRITELHQQIGPVQELVRLGIDSRNRHKEIVQQYEKARNGDPGGPVEYRSAGDYAVDKWRAWQGQEDAKARLDMYHRAAAHQTTADNAGLLPTPIVAPVVNFVDQNRTLVSVLGPRNLPGANWSRPKVTQHTAVGLQSGEKAELVSQKMLITKLNGAAATYGGYVNVSRQDADFTQPGIMDVVINDLAAMYAIQTEAAAAAAFDAAATAGLGLPTGANTADQVAASLWDAAGKIYTATKGAGRLFAVIPPGMLSSIGPMFPPGPAIPTQSPGGFEAVNFNTGLVGNIGGIPIYVSSGVGTLRILVMSTAAAEVYEDRIGALQVVEPSVLGVQVAYAGYFTPMVIEATGIIKIVKTP